DQDLDEAINFPVVGQTSRNWNESDDNSGLVEEQPVNISQRHVNTFYSTFNSVKLSIDAPVVEQAFRNWEEIDSFISFYAKTQNFVSVIRRSEYDKGVCRIHRYTCKHQDFSNVIQTFKQQNHVKGKAVVLLNNLLERKAEDSRWIINWRVDSTNNSLTSLFWMSPDQYDLYIQYRNVVQHDNTYSTNCFKIALGFFVIVDNNNRSRLVGQALMNDETVESYEWVLQTLISNTNVMPLTIITDNDLAINAAIANNKLIVEFPDTVSYFNRALFNEKKPSTYIQYKNWNHSITGSTLTHASSKFSPEIDQWITTYLTLSSLSMQQQEIAQAIWYISCLIDDFEDLGLQSNSTELSNLTQSSNLFDLTEQSLTE
ncbi:28144_t:CDS:2, partial [Gigaspora margarita]